MAPELFDVLRYPDSPICLRIYITNPASETHHNTGKPTTPSKLRQEAECKQDVPTAMLAPVPQPVAGPVSRTPAIPARRKLGHPCLQCRPSVRPSKTYETHTPVVPSSQSAYSRVVAL